MTHQATKRTNWLAWVLVLVAFLMLDRAAVRVHGSLKNAAQRNLKGFSREDMHMLVMMDPLLYGCLPAANVLAFGALIAYRRPAIRPFVLGFEIFGCASLILYTTAAVLFPEDLILPYLQLVLQPFLSAARPYLTTTNFLIISALSVVLLGAPQLVAALIGGTLTYWRRRGQGKTRRKP